MEVGWEVNCYAREGYSSRAIQKSTLKDTLFVYLSNLFIFFSFFNLFNKLIEYMLCAKQKNYDKFYWYGEQMTCGLNLHEIFNILK